ncbi:MAG: HET domain-containing protein [Candidatus Moeniiplasma glomeromycotorum]|nr:HET domain-containing protein [Candidatus Moeniiplasma glomeromycotorum]MCE8169336.1 HET domain-containing protein [Candidatus Moeniiplasma glomeromycotorum]
MANWKEHGNPFLDFTEEITQEWMDNGFSREECKKWLDIGMKAEDSNFCAWLRDEIKVDALEILNKLNTENNCQETDLREQFSEYLTKKNRESTWHLILQLRDKGFFWKEIEELVNSGLKIEDINFVCWLRDNKNVDIKQILYHRNDEQLKKDYLISRWHDKGFTDEEIGAWNSVGLGLTNIEYAVWLKDIREITPVDYLNHLDENNVDNLLREQYQKSLEVEGAQTKRFVDYLLKKHTISDIKKFFPKTESEKEIRKLELWKEFQEFRYEEVRELEFWKEFRERMREDLKKVTPEDSNITTLDGLQITIGGFKRWVEYEKQNDSKWSMKSMMENVSNLSTSTTLESFEELELNKRYLKYIEKTLIESGKPRTLQEWLNINHPTKEEKEEVEKIIIPNKEFFGNIEIEGGELDLSEYLNLEKIEIEGKSLPDFFDDSRLNQKGLGEKKLKTPLTKLILGKKPKLKKLSLFGNQLTNLDLSGCPEITDLHLDFNSLTNLDFLEGLDSEKTKTISIMVNNISSDLTPFSRFVNLEVLFLQGNSFRSSLQPLQSLTKLKELNISNTNIDSGLEYLPDSLEYLHCHAEKTDKVQKIRDLLTNEQGIIKESSGGWIIDFSQKLKLIKDGKIPTSRKERVIRNVLTSSVLFESSIKEIFEGKDKKDYESRENYELEEVVEKYERIELKEKGKEFILWKIDSRNNSPIKLIDLSEAKINNLEAIEAEKIEELENLIKQKNIRVKVGNLYEKGKIRNFAMLSYVWGGLKEDEILSLGGKKALYKAIKALELINKERKIDKDKGGVFGKLETIKFLWMDQLCIDQNNLEEKNQEVPKMAQYYDESVLTLISINFKIKDWIDNLYKTKSKEEVTREVMCKIIESEWFTRSWTLQEGLLSKQTIFMFDDCLVDGREIAQAFVNFKIPLEALEFKEIPIRTFFGLNYYDHRLNIWPFSLPTLLKLIKDRERSISADGIYSLLGALPYGDKVEVKYKPRICPECPKNPKTNISEEVKDCKHEEKNKKWTTYTKEELEDILLEVMKVGIESGYPEPIYWFGTRRQEPWKWWIPEMDENGSIIASDREFSSTLADFFESKKSMEFTKNGIKLSGSRHIISSCQKVNDSNDPLVGDYELKTEDGNVINLILGGKMRTTTEGDVLIKGDVLVIISNTNQQAYWTIITFLVSSDDESLSLASSKSSMSKKPEEKEIFIDMINYQVIQSETRLTEEAEEQIGVLLEMQRELTGASLKGSEHYKKRDIETGLSNLSGYDIEKITLIKEKLETEKKETEKYLTHEEIKYLCRTKDKSLKFRKFEELRLDGDIDKMASHLLKELDDVMEELEPMEIGLVYWTKLHSSFTDELINQWQSHNFTANQVRDWINTGLQPTDYNFCAWLRDEVKMTPIEFLNDSSSIEELKEQFSEHQNYQQSQIEIPPK